MGWHPGAGLRPGRSGTAGLPAGPGHDPAPTRNCISWPPGRLRSAAGPRPCWMARSSRSTRRHGPASAGSSSGCTSTDAAAARPARRRQYPGHVPGLRPAAASTGTPALSDEPGMPAGVRHWRGWGCPSPYWRVPTAFTGYRGADVLAASGEHGLEGVVAKRLDSAAYVPGSRRLGVGEGEEHPTARGRHRRLEARRGEARGGPVGSLLIGVDGADPGGQPAGAPLQYAGHVGTGFSAVTLDRLGQLLAPAAQRQPAVRTASRPSTAGTVTWVQPRLVAEVEFAGWTSAAGCAPRRTRACARTRTRPR